jgi:NAD+ synthetase
MNNLKEIRIEGGLRALLLEYRKQRNFSPETYLAAKSRLFRQYLTASTVNTTIVGISGGVDSAVVCAMLHYMKGQHASPIEKIVGVLLPVNRRGASNQQDALRLGREVARLFADHVIEGDLSTVQDSFLNAISLETIFGTGENPDDSNKGFAWVEGQLVSLIRLPALYFLANAFSAAAAERAITVGTINRDELNLGYWGKRGDVMDVSLVSDLHKSEVRALARYLRVPESVLEQPPKGDQYHGLSDEEELGPYEFIEWYFGSYLHASPSEQQAWWQSFEPGSCYVFEQLSAHLEAWRARNRHKFLALGDGSIHFDVYQREAPGSSQELVSQLSLAGVPDGTDNFVGYFRTDSTTFDFLPSRHATGESAGSHLNNRPIVRRDLADFGESAFILDNVLTPEECACLKHIFQREGQIEVGIHGRREGGEGTLSGDRGSRRSTTYSTVLANHLWKRIAPYFDPIRVFEDYQVSVEGFEVARACGINPLFRGIDYGIPAGDSGKGGLLVPHYDEGFSFGDGHHYTLMSVVIYLTEVSEGGETRFLLDKNRHVNALERTFKDWDGPAGTGDRILAAVKPVVGRLLLFDHRLLHDGTAERFVHGLEQQGKIILRTDIIFKACGRLPIPTNPPAGIPFRESGTYQEILVRAAKSGEVDEAYRELLREERLARGERERIRKLWKVLRDPFFRDVYLESGWTAAKKAGFYDDGADIKDYLPVREDTRWLGTPVHKVLRKLEELESSASICDTRRPYVVMLLTGALCPVTQGHINAIEESIEALQLQGHEVIGAYISPDHGSYVLEKNGPDVLDSAERIRLCELMTKDHPLIMVDSWNALRNTHAPNFTDVGRYLEAYLNRHVPTSRPIRVAFVFGADNANFVRCCADRGLATCVERPGSEQVFMTVGRSWEIRTNPRITMIRQDGGGISYSSTQARSGDLSGLDLVVRENFERFLRSKNLSYEGRPQGGFLHIRDEENFAVTHWQEGRDTDRLFGAWQELGRRIEEAFRESFELADWNVDIRTLPLSLQKQQAGVIFSSGEPVLCLDPCMEDGVANGNFHSLRVSRAFPVADCGTAPELVARPGSPGMKEQFEAIPPGSFLLLDDDYASGGTFNALQKLLPRHIQLTRGQTMSIVLPQRDGTYRDLCDRRDFLAGGN